MQRFGDKHQAGTFFAITMSLTLVALLGVTATVSAQSTWQRELRTDTIFPGQVATSATQLADGTYVAAGYSLDWYAYDLLLVHLSSDGHLLSQSILGGPGADLATWVEATPDGGCILAGLTASFGDGGLDAWVIKLSADGSPLWQKTYGGAPENWLYCIRPTSDGGYIAAGNKGEYDKGRFDGWLMKLDGQGAVLWERLFGGQSENAFYGVQATPDGGYLLNGSASTTLTWSNGWDPWFAKVDSEGRCEWEMTLGGLKSSKAYFPHLTSDGGFLLTGQNASRYQNPLFAGKVDASQRLSWLEYIGAGDGAFPLGLTQSPGGDVLLGAGIWSPRNSAEWTPWCGLVALDSRGRVIWNKLFKGYNEEHQNVMIPSSDGGYLFAGAMGASGSTPDFAVRKVDSQGDPPTACLRTPQLTLQVEPAAVTPIHLVCQEWPTSSVVMDSQASPTEYGCFGLKDTLTAAHTILEFKLFTDLHGCATREPAYALDLGDGTVTSQRDVFHAFEHAGTYDAIMKVDAGTERCTSLARFTVLEQPCLVSCSSGAQLVDPERLGVQFTASASVIQCQIRPSYTWDFGDGWMSHEANPIHYYETSGHFYWLMTVTAGDTWANTCSGDMELAYPHCSVACWAQGIANTFAPAIAYFWAGVHDTECPNPPLIEWDFDGDGTFDATGSTPTYVYEQPGTYHWQARITVLGNTCNRDGTLQVYPAKPVVTDIRGGGSPYKVTVTGTNFHPDMQVWIAGVNSPWTKIKTTPTGILIKGAASLFPKDGSATVVVLRNGDGGEMALLFYAKKRWWWDLAWVPPQFPTFEKPADKGMGLATEQKTPPRWRPLSGEGEANASINGIGMGWRLDPYSTREP